MKSGKLKKTVAVSYGVVFVAILGILIVGTFFAGQ